ncbi:uncharacterized protein LOC112591452 [Melanaphis sacchari]|uniref:uncharacterized protein LOC112591452 n=1 Tax=Melanaphis sacchari TaxID=742174 RepID=UPI000DC15997|nr:uncharacterized protein LOC112591452 [Melanaphis sacchari]
MNTISKYVQYLRQIHILSSNTFWHQYTIKQKHQFSTTINSTFLNFSSNFIKIRHLSNTFSQLGLSDTVTTNDILITSIKNAKQTSDVLQMLRLHSTAMNAQQHLQALNSLFLLQKSKRTNLSKEELTRSPEFTAMCHKIQNYSRNLELNDVMNSVKYLSYLGVSVNSNIMQMLLQLISKMINDMSLQQITFLHFLLRELSSCPLVDALKLALPIVFETQVQYKLEDNLYWQVEFLNYIAKHKLSQETYDFVMSRIIKNIDQISPKIVQQLLLCLYYKNYSTEKYIDIINRCLQYYMNHLEYIAGISDIGAILSRMIYKYSTESELFYNEQFINKIVEFIIKNEDNFENLGFLLKKLNRIGYVHRGLLDYMTNKLTSKQDILENIKFGVLLSYIAACANANYVPPGFDELKPLILTRLNVQKDVLELPWLVATFDLAVLDVWSEELLERVFSRDFLYGFLKRSDNIHDYIMLLKLYQASTTLYPGGYKGSLPPQEIIEKSIKIYQHNIIDFPLKAALEHGLGGSDYVLTGVRSKLGHFIDYLVVMRPGGYPVAIKNKIKDSKSLLLENIVGVSDNFAIAILLYKPNSYVINLNCLRGPHMLTIKTIEALGLIVLPVSLDVWDGLIDYEKIPYIMRELKSKADLNLTIN